MIRLDPCQCLFLRRSVLHQRRRAPRASTGAISRGSTRLLARGAKSNDTEIGGCDAEDFSWLRRFSRDSCTHKLGIACGFFTQPDAGFGARVLTTVPCPSHEMALQFQFFQVIHSHPSTSTSRALVRLNDLINCGCQPEINVNFISTS